MNSNLGELKNSNSDWNVRSFRRFVYIHPEDVNKLPKRPVKFYTKTTAHNVFFELDTPKCFNCSSPGHFRINCPKNQDELKEPQSLVTQRNRKPEQQNNNLECQEKVDDASPSDFTCGISSQEDGQQNENNSYSTQQQLPHSQFPPLSPPSHIFDVQQPFKNKGNKKFDDLSSLTSTRLTASPSPTPPSPRETPVDDSDSNQLSFNGTNLFAVPSAPDLKKNTENKRTRSTTSSDSFLPVQDNKKIRKNSLTTEIIKEQIESAYDLLPSVTVAAHPIDKNNFVSFVIESTGVPYKDTTNIAKKYTINLIGLSVILLDLHPNLSDRSLKTRFTKLANALKKLVSDAKDQNIDPPILSDSDLVELEDNQ